MRQVYLSRKELRKAFKFANDTWQDHPPQGRSPRKIKRDIVIGKIGELGYKKLYGDKVSEINFVSNPKGDGGYDFIYNDLKIDVKTNRGTHHSSVYYKRYTFDYLALMQFENITNSGMHLVFAGYCDKQTARKHSMVKKNQSNQNVYDIDKR